MVSPPFHLWQVHQKARSFLTSSLAYVWGPPREGWSAALDSISYAWSHLTGACMFLVKALPPPQYPRRILGGKLALTGRGRESYADTCKLRGPIKWLVATNGMWRASRCALQKTQVPGRDKGPPAPLRGRKGGGALVGGAAAESGVRVSRLQFCGSLEKPSEGKSWR